MNFSIDRAADLSAIDRTAIERLTEIVYPAEIWKDWEGWQYEWTGPEHWVRAIDEAGALVGLVGLVVRECDHDGKAMRLGGIGSVKTHPSARGRGIASKGMELAANFLRESLGCDFGMLVCEPAMVNYYARFGWRRFEGTTMAVRQGAAEPFTFLKAMVLDMVRPAPNDGVIDLLGPPW